MWFVTIQCNFKTVDFLEVTFDLDNNVYNYFPKKNNKPIYINKHSNHPPSIKSIKSINCQNQLKKEYPKRHPITIFLMDL